MFITDRWDIVLASSCTVHQLRSEDDFARPPDNRMYGYFSDPVVKKDVETILSVEIVEISQCSLLSEIEDYVTRCTDDRRVGSMLVWRSAPDQIRFFNVWPFNEAQHV